MNACTAGCKTKNHGSYAECLKANTPTVRNSSQSRDALYARERRNVTEIREYREARAQGIQPRSTRLTDIRGAVERSKATNTAVQES